MSAAAFSLIREETIDEIKSVARLYRHDRTGAEVLSLINDDENKVFGVTFRTPPEDSTGVAHILEHSVLCGSRKYPVKKPFVEMLKGSLHTFLNAMTYPDKTVYPVASQNLKDFYNLVDVYLDAVFFPLISENTFRQEGWHYELEASQGPLSFKGVVFNEMKGAYSSPAAVLGKASQLSLYPDNAYGVNSGGDPKAIPDLTYDYFKNFHRRFYHPSNARIVFYGDDDPAERLAILDAYLGQFDRVPVESAIKPQPRFDVPRKIAQTYAASPGETGRTAMVTVNWMLDRQTDETVWIALAVLEHALVGTSAAPLRKALTDSGLGEGLTGSGIGEDYFQPMFTVGLKGIEAADADKVEALVLSTLQGLADKGFDKETIAASLNSVEFALRENNTGSFPRGISLMLRTMRAWLHGDDPIGPLKFESALAAIKADLAAGVPLFENLVRDLIVSNPHRTTVLLTADVEQGAREAAEERARLDAARDAMTPDQVAAVAESTATLKTLQETPDAPADLARIPTLTLADLPRHNKLIPIAEETLSGTRTLVHDLPTSGIVYLDIGMDLHVLPPALLPYVPLFARALLQTGTATQDFVALSQRIGALTGGIAPQRVVQGHQDGASAVALQFLRGKATLERTGDLLAILRDVLTSARLDNRERVLQMALETKAGMESGLAGSGNAYANMRLRAALHESDWANEQLGGVSYLFFLRELIARIETDWPSVEAAFRTIAGLLVNRAAMVVNVTTDGENWPAVRTQVADFLAGLPQQGAVRVAWPVSSDTASEGLTFPAQVNYVVKGADIRTFGYQASGAAAVAIRHLNTTYLWDKIRVQGGAYGGSAHYDAFTGGFSFLSYRDPNLIETLAAYDQAADFLKAGIDDADLVRSIIGVIGTYDSYQLPDAKGFTSAVRTLSGITDAIRQQRREQVLAASRADFTSLADAVAGIASTGRVVVLGSAKAITEANAENGNFLKVSKVL